MNTASMSDLGISNEITTEFINEDSTEKVWLPQSNLEVMKLQQCVTKLKEEHFKVENWSQCESMQDMKVRLAECEQRCAVWETKYHNANSYGRRKDVELAELTAKTTALLMFQQQKISRLNHSKLCRRFKRSVFACYKRNDLNTSKDNLDEILENGLSDYHGSLVERERSLADIRSSLNQMKINENLHKQELAHCKQTNKELLTDADYLLNEIDALLDDIEFFKMTTENKCSELQTENEALKEAVVQNTNLANDFKIVIRLLNEEQMYKVNQLQNEMANLNSRFDQFESNALKIIDEQQECISRLESNGNKQNEDMEMQVAKLKSLLDTKNKVVPSDGDHLGNEAATKNTCAQEIKGKAERAVDQIYIQQRATPTPV